VCDQIISHVYGTSAKILGRAWYLLSNIAEGLLLPNVMRMQVVMVGESSASNMLFKAAHKQSMVGAAQKQSMMRGSPPVTGAACARTCSRRPPPAQQRQQPWLLQ
jgi:hypothetical protein